MPGPCLLGLCHKSVQNTMLHFLFIGISDCSVFQCWAPGSHQQGCHARINPGSHTFKATLNSALKMPNSEGVSTHAFSG